MSRGQLLGLGLSAGRISSWLRSGRLIRVHAGVYAVGVRRDDGLARAAAALLAAGQGAVLSHDSAAALWGLDRRWPREPEITTSPATCIRRPGIVAHRSTTLNRAHIDRNYGIRVTTVARTLTDIRPRLRRRQFARLVNQARLDHILPTEAATALLGAAAPITRSQLEDDFLAFCRRFELPTPVMNTIVNGYEVDALFPELKVIVEIDAYATHGDPVTFESDRDRDAHQFVHGLYTHRITRDRFTAQEAERLRRILHQRRG